MSLIFKISQDKSAEERDVDVAIPAHMSRQKNITSNVLETAVGKI